MDMQHCCSSRAWEPLTNVDKVIQRVGVTTVAGRYISHRRIEEDVIVNAQVLGTGVSGAVHSGRRKGGEATCAVKSYNKRGMKQRDVDFLRDEVEVYLTLDHPHIATLEGVYESKSYIHLVMEHLRGGDLAEHLMARPHRCVQESTAALYLSQMLDAFSYLHKHNVVHRDVKPDNFLFEDADEKHLKLIDFGFSKYAPEDSKLKGAMGTPEYAAPELFGTYGHKVDIWSLGVVAYVLVLGRFPISGSSRRNTLERVKAGLWSRSSEFMALSADAREFIAALLTHAPGARPSAEEALQYEFIRKSRCNIDVSPALAPGLLAFTELSQLKRLVLTMASWSLPLVDRKRLCFQFQSVDADRDGTLSLEEVRSCLGDAGKDEDVALKVLRAMSIGEKGCVSYSEFLAAAIHCEGLQLHDDALRSTFDRFDVDKCGCITLRHIRNFLGDDFNEDLQWCANRDADNNGAITYEEFASFMQEGRKPRPSLRQCKLPAWLCCFVGIFQL